MLRDRPPPSSPRPSPSPCRPPPPACLLRWMTSCRSSLTRCPGWGGSQMRRSRSRGRTRRRPRRPLRSCNRATQSWLSDWVDIYKISLETFILGIRKYSRKKLWSYLNLALIWPLIKALTLAKKYFALTSNISDHVYQNQPPAEKKQAKKCHSQ